MKQLLLCILGTTGTATIFTCASLGFFSIEANNDDPPWWFIGLKFVGLYINWTCIYLISWLVAFKYFQAAKQL